MTARDGRGGPQVPDGVPRPAAIPFAQGPNRSDMSELPGTPGTPLPGNPSSVPFGGAGPVRRALSQIPLESTNPTGFGGIMEPSSNPQEPITSGLASGAGPGPEAVVPGQDRLSNMLASEEVRYAYPVLMRLATLPNATTQTKILAQRLRGQLGVKPYQIPKYPGELDGTRGPTN
jgi:hypothetical protein